MAPSSLIVGDNPRINLLFARVNDLSVPNLDFNVGYSQSGEDLEEVDTEYVLSNELADLESEHLNVLH